MLGSTAAAPAPLITRPAISTAAVGADAHSAQPAPNTTNPASSTPLRPNRSATAPAGTSRQANTTTYPSTIQSTAEAEGRSELADSAGIARFTAETMPRTSMTQQPIAAVRASTPVLAVPGADPVTRVPPVLRRRCPVPLGTRQP